MSGWHRLKTNIIHFVFQLYYRLFVSKDLINFHRHFLNAQKILIIMPLDIEQFEIAFSVLPQFQRIFDKTEIWYLVPEGYRDFFSRRNPGEVIGYNKSDSNFLLLPKKRLKDEITWQEFDITISLNSGFDLFTAHLCLASKAPIRVSLYDDLSAPYFTFQIKDQTTHFLGQRYKNLAKYLSMMRQAENNE